MPEDNYRRSPRAVDKLNIGVFADAALDGDVPSVFVAMNEWCPNGPDVQSKPLTMEQVDALIVILQEAKSDALEMLEASRNGWVEVKPPTPAELKAKYEERAKVLHTLADVAEWLNAEGESISQLNRAIYKGTSCGASISIYGTTQDKKGTHWLDFHNGSKKSYPEDFKPHHFTIQTIVEGSDATVDSGNFVLGQTTVGMVEDWIDYMEAEADHLWEQANGDDDSDDEEK